MFERDADGLVTKVEHESDGFTMKLTELRASNEGDVGGDRRRQQRTLHTSETRINFAPQSGYAAARFSHEFDPESGLGTMTLSGRYEINTNVTGYQLQIFIYSFVNQ